jgi:peptidyl-prolyl cis-trans isomerase D
MLDALRRGATGWVAKILFALLVLSFAIWGVADVFTGFGRGSLAKVFCIEFCLDFFFLAL